MDEVAASSPQGFALFAHVQAGDVKMRSELRQSYEERSPRR